MPTPFPSGLSQSALGIAAIPQRPPYFNWWAPHTLMVREVSGPYRTPANTVLLILVDPPSTCAGAP